ncbi:hypothetical protein QQ045_022606 [Rhodiola kirilowii]
METHLQGSWDPNLHTMLGNSKSDLATLLRYQHSILEEKARVNWLQSGERNTSLFHASIKARRIQNSIRLQLEDGSHTDDPDIIGIKASDHFQELFGGFPNSGVLNIPDLITPIINEEQNSMLTRSPDEEEIRQTVFDMNPRVPQAQMVSLVNFLPTAGILLGKMSLKLCKASLMAGNYLKLFLLPTSSFCPRLKKLVLLISSGLLAYVILCTKLSPSFSMLA